MGVIGRSVIGGVVAAAAICAAASTAGAQPPAGHDNPGARRLEQQAGDLINRASRVASARDPSCRFGLPPMTAAVLVPGGAGPVVSSLIGVFRRPATPAEEAAAVDLLARPFLNLTFAEIPRDGVRLVRTADGTAVTLVAAVKLRQLGPAPAVRARCDQATLAELAVLARRAPPAVGRRATSLLRFVGRNDTPRGPPPTEGLDVSTGNGGGGGQIDPVQFINHPPGFAGGDAGATRLTLVLPDGVASADLVFSRYSSRGPNFAPVDHGRGLRLTAPVVDNVLSLAISGRGPESAFPAVIVERGPDGAVIRTIHSAQV